MPRRGKIFIECVNAIAKRIDSEREREMIRKLCKWRSNEIIKFLCVQSIWILLFIFNHLCDVSSNMHHWHQDISKWNSLRLLIKLLLSEDLRRHEMQTIDSRPNGSKRFPIHWSIVGILIQLPHVCPHFSSVNNGLSLTPFLWCLNDAHVFAFRMHRVS